MANNPISMSKIRQILQLYHLGRSKLTIATQTGICCNTLKKYLKQFTESKLSFEQISELSDKDLEKLFVKPQQKPANDKRQKLSCLCPWPPRLPLVGYRIVYYSLPKLLSKLKMSKADGSYLKEVAKIERQQLLILDDFGLQPFDSGGRAALMELIEDRHGKGL